MQAKAFDKPVVTDMDLENLDWHDATIHALGFGSKAYEFMIDLDYIVEWVKPDDSAENYKFLVAPATLVFHNVYGLHLDVEPLEAMSIDRIERTDVGRPRNAESEVMAIDWRWALVLHVGEISFRSAGFTQYFRGRPRLAMSQSLTLEERGGMSFDRILK